MLLVKPLDIVVWTYALFDNNIKIKTDLPKYLKGSF